MPTAREQWPLVGRADEVGFIRGRLAESTGIVVAGPAGVGKTRLAHECLDAGRRGRFTAVRVTATKAAAAIPFGALAPLLPAQQSGLAWTASSPVVLLNRSVAMIREKADGKRLILLIDDAHLLDEASATLVHQLAVSDSASVLLTIRVDEPCPDPITALWKDGVVDRMELKGLDTEAIEQLLTTVLEGPVDRGAVTLLAVRSGGKALFLRELVLGALADGTFRDVGGIWQLVGPLLPSDRLIGLVEARLQSLSSHEREIMEVVAFGEPIGRAELAAFTDLETAESLERAGFLSSTLNGKRLEFAPVHPVYGDVLRSRIPAVRVASIARRLAEAVEATGARRREDVLRIATWRLDGGGGKPDLMLEAASMARWRYDFPLAERLARSAVDAGAGFDASLLLAQIHARQRRGAEAAKALAGLVAEAKTDDDRGLLAVVRLDHIGWSLGDLDEGMRIAEEALSSIQDAGWKEKIAGRYWGLVVLARGPAACAELADPLIAAGWGRSAGVGSMAVVVAFNRLGRFDAANVVARRGHEAWTASQERPDWDVGMDLALRCDGLAYAGRFLEAEQLASEGYQRALLEGNVEAQAFLAMYLGRMAGDCGFMEESVQYEREAFALFQQLGRPLEGQFCMPFLVTALALSGRTDEAAAWLGGLDTAGSATLFVQTDLLSARAWVDVAQGDLPEARTYFEQSARFGMEVGDLVGAASALHGLARIGFPADVTGRLAELAEVIEGDLVQVRLAHAEALASDDATALDVVARTFEKMGSYLLAAEAAAAAGVVWQRSGSERHATAAHNHARSLAAKTKCVSTPGLQVVEAGVRLTRTEREIALLAAAGHSNQEIAAKKSLSRRTIENHLHRVFLKLGVESRRQLKAVLDAGPDSPE